jgi:hypothetical protein
MARAVTTRPSCGSTVSPFAAGCAVCGEGLVATRAQRERRSLRSIPGTARLPRVSGQDALVGPDDRARYA